jgi:ER membrane protein complex subunit 4
MADFLSNVLIFSRSGRTDLSSPPGFNNTINPSWCDIAKENDQNQTLIIKKSWEIALGPIKQVRQNWFFFMHA